MANFLQLPAEHQIRHLLQIWNAWTGLKQSPWPIRNEPLFSNLSWSPDRSKIMAADDHGGSILVNIWRAKNGLLATTYRKHAGAIISSLWSPDSMWIATMAAMRKIGPQSHP